MSNLWLTSLNTRQVNLPTTTLTRQTIVKKVGIIDPDNPLAHNNRTSNSTIHRGNNPITSSLKINLAIGRSGRISLAMAPNKQVINRAFSSDLPTTPLLILLSSLCSISSPCNSHSQPNLSFTVIGADLQNTLFRTVPSPRKPSLASKKV